MYRHIYIYIYVCIHVRILHVYDRVREGAPGREGYTLHFIHTLYNAMHNTCVVIVTCDNVVILYSDTISW